MGLSAGAGGMSSGMIYKGYFVLTYLQQVRWPDLQYLPTCLDSSYMYL